MDTQYRAVVKGVGHYLPETILTNHDLSKLMDTSDEWIRERTGICERRTADLKHGTSDLGLFASQEAIKHAGLEPDDIDLIIAATLSPDYFFPGIGVMIQEKLGINTVPAMDVRGQCSGFSWSMANADAFIGLGNTERFSWSGVKFKRVSLSSAIEVETSRFYLVTALEQLFLVLSLVTIGLVPTMKYVA